MAGGAQQPRSGRGGQGLASTEDANHRDGGLFLLCVPVGVVDGRADETRSPRDELPFLGLMETIERGRF
eukprot:scaffold73855_cov63-Phaeocystis_antarctica.AAC.5